MKPSNARTNLEYLIALACCSLAIFYVFFVPISSGFSLLYGESTDALIEVSILEHWHNVLYGGSNWLITNYFYPSSGTLGYNDTYFAPGIIHAQLRHLVDP